jgi:hypothetical protein
LQVDLGRRNDTSFNSFAELLVGGQIFDASGVAPLPGDWSTYTATFTGTSADAGDAITIALLSYGVQGDFDNVTMTDSVPEPTVISMLALGLLGLAAMGWRRKRAGLAVS